ncbi:MAG TPA: hypothetical protein V6C84_22080 [Coleofasciculaceae cyanobacterium]|jgi:hypothetical protein
MLQSKGRRVTAETFLSQLSLERVFQDLGLSFLWVCAYKTSCRETIHTEN